MAFTIGQQNAINTVNEHFFASLEMMIKRFTIGAVAI